MPRHDNDVFDASGDLKPRKKPLERCFKNIEDKRICEPAPIDYTPSEDYLSALEAWEDKEKLKALCQMLLQDYLCYDYAVPPLCMQFA